MFALKTRNTSPADESLVSLSEITTSLEWLISPVSKEVFFAEYWEKRPLVVRRNQPNYFSRLMSLDEVDRVLTTLDMRYPNVTLKNADGNVTADDYTVDGTGLDVAKVYQLFDKGSTIVLAFLDNVVPTLASLCRNLECEFSFPCQTNVYLTPGRAKGANHHYDTHDVFVLQVVNSKHWTTYGTPVELPLKGQEFDASVHNRGTPTLSFDLEAGDIAYIPRGVVHDARSAEEASLHITAGVLAYTWADLLLELAAAFSLNRPAFRKALPPGFARAGFKRTQAQEILQDLLQQLSASSDVEEILDRFASEFISTRPPLLTGQLAQLASLHRLEIASEVGARPSFVPHMQTDGSSISVSCYGRKITFPVHATEALRYALSNSRFVIQDLPGNLDNKGKLTLIRRLIREGLVVILST